MTLTTSVVICAYTEARWEQLCQAVSSVQAQRRPVDEIIVVIDHNDALLDRARVAFSSATVLANASSQGLSGARNTGIDASTGDIVCFLDDDAAAEEDWSTHLLAPYDDRGVLGVGGAATPTWETAEPAWWPGEFGWVVGCSYRGQPTTTSPVRNLMGCNMSLRRTVLAAVGGFDTGLGRQGDNQLGCEETELCIRAGQLFPDGVFLHEPAAVVHHHVPGQRASWRYFRDRCRAEGISKAGVARRVGRSAALASETGYVRQVLPTGVLTNLGRSLHGDLAGVARAGAIVAGLGLTATGFLSARWAPRRQSAQIPAIPETAHAEPVLPLVIDLAAPLPAIDPSRGDEPPYERALCLVTVGGRPVGKVQLALDEAVLAPELVGARLRQGLGPAVDLSSAGGGPSAHPPADATVVIATRERPERLAECLRSVFAGDLQPERVVVVDNAPTTTRTAELVAELSATEPRLRYVREDRPGLARAHNAALPHVLTPIVAFTDDDVLVDARWLARLVDAFADDDGRLRHRDDRAARAGHPAAAVGGGQRHLRQGSAAAASSTPAPTGRPIRCSPTPRASSAPAPTWRSGPTTCAVVAASTPPSAPARWPWVGTIWPPSTTWSATVTDSSTSRARSSCTSTTATTPPCAVRPTATAPDSGLTSPAA